MAAEWTGDPDSWDPSGDLLGVLRDLSGIAAPTGNEDRLTRALHAYLIRRGFRIETDRLGQIVVSVGPADAETSVMLVAHQDELGLVVRAVESDGYLRVHRLGGVPERVLPGEHLRVHARSGDVAAIVGVKSHHLTPIDEKYVAQPAPSLYLDAGFRSADEARARGIEVGDPVTYAPVWAELPNGRVVGKSLDNRLGVGALLRTLDQLEAVKLQSRVHIVFSCLEEFNLQGVLTMAQRLQPTIAIAIDIVPATDTPDLLGDGTTTIGAGPSLSRLTFHGRGTLGGLVPHPSLVRALELAAGEANVALQYDAIIGCVNDGAYLPMATTEGIATVALGIPCRYTHSPVETAQISDVVDTAALITQFCSTAHTLSLDRGADQIEIL